MSEIDSLSKDVKETASPPTQTQSRKSQPGLTLTFKYWQENLGEERLDVSETNSDTRQSPAGPPLSQKTTRRSLLYPRRKIKIYTERVKRTQENKRTTRKDSKEERKYKRKQKENETKDKKINKTTRNQSRRYQAEVYNNHP